MLAESIGDMCGQINKSFVSAADLSGYMVNLEDPALGFAKTMWQISMILAAVVFAIIACYELYAQSVRTEGHGGPMGTAEIVFKIMFKVAVCYIVLQVSFDMLVGVFGTSNDLIAAFAGKGEGMIGRFKGQVIDVDAVEAAVPDGFWASLGCWLCTVIVWLLSWAVKVVAWGLILIRMLQVYLYLIVSPIPLATLPSRELSQIGKGFLKNFVAVCIQGALIYLVVQLFPAIIATTLGGAYPKADDFLSILLVAVVYSVAIIVTLVGTQQLSRRICGAA